MYRIYCDNYLIYDQQIKNLKVYSPKLELELNKTGSFSFVIYPDHPHFDKLEKLISTITVYQDNEMIFRGRILNDLQGFYNEKQVSCEGELAFLCDSIQRPYDFMSEDNHTTIADLFTFFITNHNAQVSEDRRFIVGNITVTDSNNYIVRSDSTYLNTWDSINKKLIETNGGYLWVRHEANGNYIDYLSDFSILSNQKIEFGKNLLDIGKTVKGEDIMTALIPLGAKAENSEERVTISELEDQQTGEIYKTGDYVYSPAAVEEYGWIFKTNIWEDVTDDSNLLNKAKDYLSTNINLGVTIELTAFDLAALNPNVNPFQIGRYVKIETNPHGLNANYLIKKLSLDITNPQNDKLTVGTTYSTFTEQTNNNNDAIKNEITIQINESKTENQTVIREIYQQISTEIQTNSESILTKVSDDYYLKSEADRLVSSINTEFEQTKNSFEFTFNQFQQSIDNVQSGTDAQFQEISKYIRFENGNIILGEQGNKLTLKIQNDRISFLENGVEIAYWQNRKFYAVDGEFINSLTLGNFAFIPRGNGNLSFKKVK